MFARERQAAFATAYWAKNDDQRPDSPLMEEHNEVSREYPRIGFGTIERLAWLLNLRLSKLANRIRSAG